MLLKLAEINGYILIIINWIGIALNEKRKLDELIECVFFETIDDFFM